MKLLKKLWALLTAYPDSWDDYYPLGHRWLVYKRLPFLLGILLAVALIWLLRPSAPQKIPEFFVDDPALKQYSGQAILKTPDGGVIYRGQVAMGLRSGYGVELSTDGADERTAYEGGFLQGRYHGEGTLYSPNGEKLYEGAFQNGLYDGPGALYAAGKALYRGQFAQGLYNGLGTLYQGEEKLYEGSFLDGRYDGEGTLYGKDGELIYTGGFRRGGYDGQGVELSPDGEKLYEGGFRNGLRDGEGTLYSGKRFRFQGVFTGGEPGPSGSLYNGQGQMLYSGPAYRGQPDYLALLGMPLAEMQTCVKEVPSIYYDQDEAGFLYRELGFAALARYDYSALDPTPSGGMPPILGGDGVQATPEPAPFQQMLEQGFDTSLFSAPEDNLVAGTILVEGARLSGQIPADVIPVSGRAQSPFEAFMMSRVAGIADPMAMARFPAQAMKRGDHLYEVSGLSEIAPGQLDGIFRETIYYLWEAGAAQKGTPPVILCSKAKFGG